MGFYIGRKNKMKKEKFVRVLICKAGEMPRVEIIENTLANLQEFVSGYIEVSYAVENVIMILNEEGKMQDLKPNFILSSYDIVVGDVLFIGNAGEEFASISDEEILSVLAHLGAIGRVDIDSLIKNGLLKQMIETRNDNSVYTY
jgi:Domain of unknown function (DUF3846)